MKKLLMLLIFFTFSTACTNSNANEYEEEYIIAEGQDDIQKGQSCPGGDRNCNGIPDSEE